MSRILIVDDDPMVLELVRELLSMQGHPMDCADNGAEALARLKQTSYDLLIIDRNMPVMDGIAAITAIRRDPLLKGLKILMFTAASDPRMIAEAVQAGADGYLSKPIQLQEFAATVRKALGQ